MIAAAGPMTVCLGYAEASVGGGRYNAAICVTGDGVLGTHRKVHQPAGGADLSGRRRLLGVRHTGGPTRHADRLRQDLPGGRARLAAADAHIIAALSAWPASITDRASRLPADRQSRLFDLYDCARAAENQVVVVSSNQTGVMGNLRFLGQAKVVGPGGDILATTRAKGGLAKVAIDVEAEVGRARKVLNHLAELRPDTYRSPL